MAERSKVPEPGDRVRIPLLSELCFLFGVLLDPFSVSRSALHFCFPALLPTLPLPVELHSCMGVHGLATYLRENKRLVASSLEFGRGNDETVVVIDGFS